MAFFGGSTSTATATTDAKDVELVDPPGDSISCLDFSPTADYLAVGCWNNEVSVGLG
jgi:mRNA export factor